MFVGVLSIAEGFRSGDEVGRRSSDTVIVMRAGSDTEMTSGLSGDHARIIKDTPGIARDAERPAGIAGAVRHRRPPARSGAEPTPTCRCAASRRRAFKVHTNVKIVEGRAFEPGRNEIVAGRAASPPVQRTSPSGRSVRWGENQWQVVGIFEAGGSAAESELWCDAKVLQPAYRRGNSYQSRLRPARVAPTRFDQLKDALTTDPQLSVTAIREPEYYARQSQTLQTIIRTIGVAIAGLMGIGAVFGAVNTMYNAVASRTREIATLRALGFGSLPVVVSVLAEAVALSVDRRGDGRAARLGWPSTATRPRR